MLEQMMPSYKHVNTIHALFQRVPEDWTIKSFNSFTKELNRRYSKNNEALVLSITKHKGFVNSLKYFKKQIFSKNIQNYKFVEKGDFAYSTIHLDEGAIGLLKEFDKGYISPMYTVFRTDGSVDDDFLYLLLKSDMLFQAYKALGEGSINRRKSISFEKLSLLKIAMPNLQEQQKIAFIFSKVDELIQNLEQIIVQTRRLKRGLMQRLLARGIGHTKFEKVEWNYGKEIEMPQEWKVVFLDDVARRGTGHTPDVKISEYYNGGIKWVSLADSNRLDNVYIWETTKEISKEGIENSSAVIHPVGTVIMSRDAGVGKSAIIKTEMAVSQHFVTWRCGEYLNNIFLYYILQYWKPLFEAIAIGTTIKTIGLPFFKKLRIPLPPMKEQQEIAFILSNVDDDISLNHKFKVECKNLRRGLMQKLLNGTIRVKA